MSIPADGSSDCVMGRVLYNEVGAVSEDVVSVGAFDTSARRYWLYAASGPGAPLQLLSVDWDSGSVSAPITPSGDLPGTLVYLPPA